MGEYEVAKDSPTKIDNLRDVSRPISDASATEIDQLRHALRPVSEASRRDLHDLREGIRRFTGDAAVEFDQLREALMPFRNVDPAQDGVDLSSLTSEQRGKLIHAVGDFLGGMGKRLSGEALAAKRAADRWRASPGKTRGSGIVTVEIPVDKRLLPDYDDPAKKGDLNRALAIRAWQIGLKEGGVHVELDELGRAYDYHLDWRPTLNVLAPDGAPIPVDEYWHSRIDSELDSLKGKREKAYLRYATTYASLEGIARSIAQIREDRARMIREGEELLRKSPDFGGQVIAAFYIAQVNAIIDLASDAVSAGTYAARQLPRLGGGEALEAPRIPKIPYPGKYGEIYGKRMFEPDAKIAVSLLLAGRASSVLKVLRGGFNTSAPFIRLPAQIMAGIARTGIGLQLGSAVRSALIEAVETVYSDAPMSKKLKALAAFAATTVELVAWRKGTGKPRGVDGSGGKDRLESAPDKRLSSSNRTVESAKAGKTAPPPKAGQAKKIVERAPDTAEIPPGKPSGPDAPQRTKGAKRRVATSTSKTTRYHRPSDPVVERVPRKQHSDDLSPKDDTAAQLSEAQQAQERSTRKSQRFSPRRKEKVAATGPETQLRPGVAKRTTRVSGWKPIPERQVAVDPRRVADHARKLGHTLPSGGPRDKGGFRGQYYASHAEKQQIVTYPNRSIGVSKPMCADCIRFFQKEAAFRGRPQIVSDPRATRVFEPNGAVTEYGRDGTVVQHSPDGRSVKVRPPNGSRQGPADARGGQRPPSKGKPKPNG